MWIVLSLILWQGQFLLGLLIMTSEVTGGSGNCNFPLVCVLQTVDISMIHNKRLHKADVTIFNINISSY